MSQFKRYMEIIQESEKNVDPLVAGNKKFVWFEKSKIKHFSKSEILAAFGKEIDTSNGVMEWFCDQKNWINYIL